MKEQKEFPTRRHRQSAEPRRTYKGDEFENSAPVGGASLAPSTLSKARLRKVMLRRRIWEKMDRDADPSRGIHTRLNEYQLAILQAACELDGTSLQRVVSRLIQEFAEERLGIVQEDSEGYGSEPSPTEQSGTEASGTEG